MQLERILYVEDDADIREVASMALEVVGGFEVLACESGAEALSRVEGFKPQLIVLDVMMPEMDGPATLRRLQAADSTVKIPVIFMTAKVQPGEIAEFLALGARDVVAKPFDPMTLSDSLRQIWQRIEESST
jgi:CheY-like chemotaxis protein